MFTCEDVAVEVFDINRSDFNRNNQRYIEQELKRQGVTYKVKLVNGIQVKYYAITKAGLDGEDGSAFKKALLNFHVPEMLLNDFIEILMGLTPTPKLSQQVGMWLKKEGYTTTRRYNSEQVKESWIINKDELDT